MKRIDSIKNPQVKTWKKLHTKKERDKSGLFFIEGFHLVEEALKTKAIIKELIITEQTEIPAHWNIDDVSVIMVTDDIMKMISETETPQGIAAICYQQTNEEVLHTAQKILLLDAVQDPGNLGTIIRTADAAGVEVVVIGEGSVDTYNGKVIRSTQGALFHLPVIKKDLHEVVKQLKERDVKLYGTSLENGQPYTDVQPSSSVALIVGNEGNGVSKELLEATDTNLYIPIYGKSESLNVAVATGVLLYYLYV
ncbi:TrmH family RNA methyltransferase [Metabacillus iocasae]|uniref:TrmH family RNA methyltransferase n=1 Tax=Priestia iocasae TaxID=2291674 RepID=A0ABS2QP89_9BACI|nr:RNA methyltransferase [Metabacillus iocasae]MBM7701263.1 TrmH family RNA methyltransferase [Metabacillus iocasae]